MTNGIKRVLFVLCAWVVLGFAGDAAAQECAKCGDKKECVCKQKEGKTCDGNCPRKKAGKCSGNCPRKLAGKCPGRCQRQGELCPCGMKPGSCKACKEATKEAEKREKVLAERAKKRAEKEREQTARLRKEFEEAVKNGRKMLEEEEKGAK